MACTVRRMAMASLTAVIRDIAPRSGCEGGHTRVLYILQAQCNVFYTCVHVYHSMLVVLFVMVQLSYPGAF